MKMKKYKLGEIADFVSSKIDSNELPLSQYVTTDCILQNKNGRECAVNLPPKNTKVTEFQKGDILIANIRPYLKKIWFATETGGASADVLVIRAKKNVDENFVYYATSQDLFFDFVMKSTKGSRMPRGEKSSIRNFPISVPALEEQSRIASVLSALDEKIALNKKICAELEAMAKEVYDYWFVQFDFPNDKNQPYKSSGGKMTFNQTLKRPVPANWEVGNLNIIANFVNGIACQKHRPKDNAHKLPVIKIREMHEGYSNDTEFVSDKIPKNVIVNSGDLLFSWSASLEIKIWNLEKGGLNQHIFKVEPKSWFPKTFIYFVLKDYIVKFRQIADARKTTMGHITQDHLEQSRVSLPPPEILSKFNSLVSPLFERQLSLNKEISELKSLRDFLLPLLMNGQVSVS